MPSSPVQVFDDVASTQDIAQQQLRAGAPSGTWIVARAQSAGRGRRGRTWLSPAGGLYASLVLRPTLDVTRATRISFAAALAVLRALDAQGTPGVWKWPNDVLVRASGNNALYGDHKKAAGVLLEAVMDGPRFVGVVVGVGVNVGGVAADVADIATGVDVDVDALFTALRSTMDTAVHDVHSDAGWRATRDALRARAWITGKRVRVDGVVGVAADIDDDGALVVVNDDGDRVGVNAGEVVLASLNGVSE